MVTRTNSSLVSRMMRAAQFDSQLYEEVERDTGATGQAALVVLIVGVAAAISGIIGGSVLGAIVGIIGVLVSWVLWSFITYWVGTTFFATPETNVTPGQMLRTIGFAQSPGVLRIFDFIPGLGPLIAVIVSIWVLITGIIAIRQAMDFSTGRAIGTAIVGWLIQAIIMAIVAIITLR